MIGELELVWISIIYERLFEFCFYCGILDHSHKDCTLWKKSNEHELEDCLPCGLWLRAQQKRLKGTNIPPW